MEENNSSLEYLGGEELTLRYYWRCGDCGVLIENNKRNPVVDANGNIEVPPDYGCPICEAQDGGYPFRFYTAERLEEKENQMRELLKIFGD